MAITTTFRFAFRLVPPSLSAKERIAESFFFFLSLLFGSNTTRQVDDQTDIARTDHSCEAAALTV